MCVILFQVVVSEKVKNLRRLEAQRNELNAKGKEDYIFLNELFVSKSFLKVYFQIMIN